MTAGPATLDAVPGHGMVVGDGRRALDHDDAPSPPPTDGGDGAHRWVVGGIVAALLAAVVGLSRVGDEVEVRVPDPVTGGLVLAPPAPVGPVVWRWSAPLSAERDLVGLAHVGTDLVWASRRGVLAASTPGLVVVAHATLDGTRRWSRAFEDPGTAVLVGGGTDDLALMSAPPLDDPPVGAHTFVDRSTVVALDADGNTAWQVRLAGTHTAGSLDAARHRLVVRDEVEVREFDTDDGSITARMPHVVDDSGVRVAHRQADAWLVPTTTGWEVRPDTGATRRIDTTVGPAVTSGLVVVADGSTVRARTRGDQRPAWEVDLGAPVVAVAGEPAPGTGLDEQGGPFPLPTTSTIPVVSVTTEDGRGAITTLLSATGRVVTRPDTRDPWGAHLNVRITIDGRDWSLCAHSSWTWPPGTCPHDLALADDHGDVVASVDDVTGVGRASDTWSRITRVGMVLQDGDAVQLRRWPDLSLGWTLPDGAVDSLPNPLMVVTTRRGVGIGTNAATRDSVAWYS